MAQKIKWGKKGDLVDSGVTAVIAAINSEQQRRKQQQLQIRFRHCKLVNFVSGSGSTKRLLANSPGKGQLATGKNGNKITMSWNRDESKAKL